MSGDNKSKTCIRSCRFGRTIVQNIHFKNNTITSYLTSMSYNETIVEENLLFVELPLVITLVVEDCHESRNLRALRMCFSH
jgi:hypothetical protein